MLSASWEVLSGGIVIPFDVTDNAPFSLAPTPAHSIDVVVVASASSQNGNRSFVTVTSPSGIRARVTIESPPQGAIGDDFEAVLVRELVLPVGFALGASEFGPVIGLIRLRGFLVRVRLTGATQRDGSGRKAS